MEKKTTKKENLGNIKEALARAVVNNVISNYEYQTYEKFIDHEIALLDKKANNRGNKANEQENNTITEITLQLLKECGEPKTLTELLEYDELATFTTREGKRISNQKLNFIMTNLKNTGLVVNIKDKKKSMYKAV